MKKIILTLILSIFTFVGCGVQTESVNAPTSDEDVTLTTSQTITETTITTTETTSTTTEVTSTTTEIEATVLSESTPVTSESVTLLETTTEAVTTIRIDPAQSAKETKTPITIAVTETQNPVITEEYVVYKPSTKYVHRSTCRWNKGDATLITETSGVEARLCNECNPDIEIVSEYIPPEPTIPSKDGLAYIKHFSRGTYYAYGGERYGGSGRYLYDCSVGDGNGIKGSIASSYIYRNYGYNYNGSRTTVYLEVNGYPELNGWYFLDDSDAGNSDVIDFFYYYESNCQFQSQGVVEVDAYI